MTKIILLSTLTLLVLGALFNQRVEAQAKPEDNPATTSEIETLKRKVAELESKNQEVMRLLTEMKERLDATDRRSQMIPASEKPRAADRDASIEPAQQESAKDLDKNVVRWPELLSDGNKLKLYGLLRLDLNLDSQRPNNGQAPLFITSEDSQLGKAAGNFSMHPRLTRFGVDWAGPLLTSLGDGKLAGKLEVDFANGGLESRQIIRIRHAYLKLNWKRFSLLGGQTSDMFSPLYPTVNGANAMWNAGNVGDRRPQLRLAYEPKAGRGEWSFVGGFGLMGAIDGQDLDSNGFRDGEESNRPNLQARIGYSRPLWIEGPSASFGVSGFYGWVNTSRAIAGRDSFHSQLINIDYNLPLTKRLALRGEGWWGRNLSDLRGGAGQGINLADGREIRSRGGWSELSLKLSRYWSLHPGYTTDDPVNIDIPIGGRTRNHSFYLGNRFPLSEYFLIGVDYLRWQTDYKGFLRGLDHRGDIFFQYSF